jgi:hypothetical protein
MTSARRVLVPVAGRQDHSRLRARLLASLSRSGATSMTFLRTIHPAADPAERRRVERGLKAMARDEAAGPYEVVVEEDEHPRAAILRRVAESDLVVLGMPRGERHRGGIGGLAGMIARQSTVPLVLIGTRTGRSRRIVPAAFRNR